MSDGRRMSRRRADVPERTLPRWLLRARDLLHARFWENVRPDEITLEIGAHPVHLKQFCRP